MRSSTQSGIRFSGIVLGILFAVSGVAAQSVAVGYTELKLQGGSNVAPAGSAIFSYRNSEGVLVSEAGVGAVRILKRGRIFVDAGTRTGLAIVNPQVETSLLTLSLRNSAGQVVDQSTLVLEPGHHTAQFVDQLFNNVPDSFRGSLTFESGSGLGAITLRQSLNSYLEPLYATLPVVDLDASASAQPLTFPHLAAGGGYQTEVVLINGGSALSKGRIRFFGSDGLPLILILDSIQTSEVLYELEPDGVFRAALAGGGQVQVGYAVLTPEVGATPSGSVIFKLSADGQLLSEAGVGATAPTNAAKISIDNVGRETGFAVANPGTEPAQLRIRLQDRYGAIKREINETIPAGGHFSKLVQQLFPAVSAGFTGLIEIDSSVPVVPIALQITINSRGVSVLTTLPVADLAASPSHGDMIFPQLAVGAGFSTRIVLIATDPSEFTLSHHTSDSAPWPIGSAGRPSGQFRLAAGQGVRLFPGSDARIASVSVRDPITNLPTSEISVTAGRSAMPLIIVMDTLGNARDDLALEYSSLDPNVAAVRSDGLITGMTSGFSTLVIHGGGRVATATISVVTMAPITPGFATGVTQGASGTVFLTTEEQTLLKVEQAETLYAGTPHRAGFRNDLRLLSQFNGPSSLSIDPLGQLYVSDSGNHVIRGVPPGNTDSVFTLSGHDGVAGFADGSGAALFNTPKGVALDNLGFLWVVDQGNHVIRRINIVSGEVRTVAGSAGHAGNRDGVGAAALFDTPTGIAVEPESLVEQLRRRDGPPPPVRVVVTDTKNGIIRRITENGDVSTVRTGAVAAISAIAGKGFPAEVDGAPLTFNSPTGIAVGRLGTIYVTESALGQVRSILPTGEVVTVSASGSFVNPTGIVIGKDGEIIVASTGTSLTSIRPSAPVITSVNPDAVNTAGGELVEVRGANFESNAVLNIANTPIPFTFHDTTRISFVTPALPAGQTSLVLTTRGGAAVARFRVGNAISLTFGSIVQGEIAQPAEIDLIPFTAGQGDRILLTLVRTRGFNPDFGRNPLVSILSPSGQAVGTAFEATNEREFILPATGTYLVRVSADNLTDTGTYSLGLERLDGVTAIDATVRFGDILNGTITQAAQSDLITFSGNANDRVLLSLVRTGGFNPDFGRNPRVWMLGPAGQAVGTSLEATGEREFVLPATGNYLLRVGADNLSDSGTYSLGLERLDGVTAIDATVGFGDILKRTITQAAQSDLITFPGNANDRVLLSLVRTGGFNPDFGRNPRVWMLGPAGQAVGTSLEATGEREFVLPATGNYLLRVGADNLSDSGAYSLGLERLDGVTAIDATVGFGAILEGTVTQAAQSDLITFSGNANDRVLLSLVRTGGFNPDFGRNPRVWVHGPTGQAVGTSLEATGEREFVLPATGNYLLRVGADNLSDSGAYSLGLERLDGVTAIDATVGFGAILEGTVTQAAQSDLITFSGNANDRVLLSLVRTGGFNPDFGRNPRVWVHGPTGQAVGTSLEATGEREFVLPATGNYLLRVGADNLSDSGAYSLGLERLDGVTAIDATVGFGAILKGTVTQAAQSDLITFSGNANDRVLLSLVRTGGFNPDFGRNPRVWVHGPTGQAVGTSLEATGEREFVLPATGNYLLRVGADNLSDSGAYSLGLERLDGVTAIDATVGFGAILKGTVTQAAQSDLITFSGNANDRVLLSLVRTGGFNPDFGRNPRVWMHGPAGQAVGTSLEATGEREFVLPATGNYLLRVGADNLSDSGTYSLGLERLDGVTAIDATVSFGAILNGTITQAAENDLITFSGSANDRVLLSLVRTGGFNPDFGRNPMASVTTASGQVLVTWEATGQREFTLSATGTYLVRVRADNLSDTGTYSLSLAKLSALTSN